MSTKQTTKPSDYGHTLPTLAEGAEAFRTIVDQESGVSLGQAYRTAYLARSVAGMSVRDLADAAHLSKAPSTRTVQSWCIAGEILLALDAIDATAHPADATPFECRRVGAYVKVGTVRAAIAAHDDDAEALWKALSKALREALKAEAGKAATRKARPADGSEAEAEAEAPESRDATPWQGATKALAEAQRRINGAAGTVSEATTAEDVAAMVAILATLDTIARTVQGALTKAPASAKAEAASNVGARA